MLSLPSFEAIFFWIAAIGLVGGALSVVLNRNPVACALSLAVTFVFLAGLFVTLEAFFLAMVQIIVYAGAVMVLFLFIIMLLDLREEVRRPFPWGKVVLAVLVAGLFATFFKRVLDHLPEGSRVLEWGSQPAADAQRVGEVLFSRFLLPFEATAVLLLVATLGVVILSRRMAQK